MRAVVRRSFIAVAMVTLLFHLVPQAAGAGQRMVTVNGVVLGPRDLALADASVGFRVPDGRYWYDAPSGYWGVLGGPVLGRLPPQPQAPSAVSPQPQQRPLQQQQQHGYTYQSPSHSFGSMWFAPGRADRPQEEDWAGLRTSE
jgi:hypothetical protein